MATGCFPKRAAAALFKKIPLELMPSSVNKEIFNEKLLAEAAAMGDVDTVSDLLNEGVSVDAEEYNKVLFYASKNYATPLQLAAANGYVNCVEILLKYGANVNAKDRFDVTALHMAAEHGNYHCLVALLDANADCSLPTKYSQIGSYAALPHHGGTTALHLAASKNDIKCVKELILYGADYNAVDERGRTSLYIAAQAGFSECVMAHLKTAVGRDILSLPSFNTFDTPLHFAVGYQMLDCVRELLCLGSDPNHKNFNGSSPLHLAVTSSSENEEISFEILKMLVLEGYNTDVNLTDNGDLTPLHYACFNYNSISRRRPDMAKFLISHGADTNIKNPHEYSLLEYELLSTNNDFGLLKQIVNNMLHVPHLKSLKIIDCSLYNTEIPISSTHGELQEHYVMHRIHREVLYGSLAPLAENPSNHQQIEFSRNRIALDDLDEEEEDALNYLEDFVNVRRLLSSVRSRHQLLTPPRYPIAHNTRYFEDLFSGNVAEPSRTFDSPHNRTSFIEKHTWYENVASNPRTLQHYCRYAIRQRLGPEKLKHIKKLPVPNALQSYLLLEFDH